MKNPSLAAGRRTSDRIKLSSIAALGALGLSIDASAQGVTDDPIDSIDGIESYEILADDTLQITLESGETLTLASDAYVVIGDQIFLRENGAALVQAAIQGGIGNATLLAAAAGLGAFRLASELGEDDGDDTTSPTETDTTSPVFTSDSSATTAENVSTETVVYDADATDNATITYSLSGTDATLFAIDSSTGEVSFLASPDFEAPGDDDGDGVFEITITASDGTNTSSLDVAITLTDLNDEAPVFTSADSVDAVPENTTDTVYTASVTDADSAGSEITFSLAEGGDNAHFSIDASTGEVTLNDNVDFDTPLDSDGDNVYNIEIIASDGTNETTHEVAITITDAGDEQPVFTSESSASVAENTAGVVYTAAATPDVEGAAVSYAIAGGADAALFEIDATTGELKFLAAPDHDSAGDADGDNAYVVTIRATEANGQSATQTVTISVTDMADENPVFTSNASANVDEGETGTGIVPAATADLEGDAVSIAISGGADASLFQINQTTGELEFTAAPDHEAPGDGGDAAGDNVYEVELTATDESGNTSTQTISVTVNDVADEGPVFTSGTTVSIDENQTDTGYTAQATPDVDGATITYSIAGGLHADWFDIDPDTGELSFKSAPDYEATTDGFAFTGRAINDGSGWQIVADASATGLLTNFIDQDFLEPADPIQVDGSSVSRTRFAGTIEIDGHTVVVLSGDGSGEVTETATIQLLFPSGVDPSGITLPDVSDIAAMLSTEQFVVRIDNNFEVDIAATDEDGNVSTRTISVTVNDVADEGPVFTSPASITVAENETDTGYVPVATPDVDGAAVSYEITGGADQAQFDLDASGELVFLSAPDHEAPADMANAASGAVAGDNVYEVEITATDEDGNQTAQTILVTVGDTADEDPAFTSGTTASANEQQTDTGYTAQATADVDTDDISYSIAGGAHADLFTIDADTGELSFKSAPDYDAPPAGYAYLGYATYPISNHTLQGEFVEAQTSFVTENPASATGSLDGRLDAREAVLINGEDTGAIYVGTLLIGGQTMIVTLNAAGDTYTVYAPIGTDPDAISWPGSIFSLPASNAAYDLPTSNTYQVLVEADDGTNSAQQIVTITVNEVDDSPIFANTVTDITIDEGTSRLVTLFDADATDPNGANPSVADDGITYALTGDDASEFAIDADTGELTFAVGAYARDHENPADTGGDNTYDVSIVATDTDGETSTLDLTINLRDVRDEDPVFTSADSASMDENTTQTGITPDATPDFASDTVTYSIVGGAHADLFEIDATTGELVFKDAPDHEAAPVQFRAGSVATYIVGSQPTPTVSAAQTYVLTADDGVFEVGDPITRDGEGSSTSYYAGTVIIDGHTMIVTTNSPTGEVTTNSFVGIWAPEGASVTFPDFSTLTISTDPYTLESSNQYQVMVEADDGTNNSTQTITITVDDVADEDPVFTSGTTISVDENETDTGYTAAATPDVDRASITYSLLDDADGQLFDIDPDTGELTLKAGVDHEALPSGFAHKDIAAYRTDNGDFDGSGSVPTIDYLTDDDSTGIGNSILENGESVYYRNNNYVETYVGTVVIDGHTMIVALSSDGRSYLVYAPADVDPDTINWPSNFSDLTVSTDDFELPTANILSVSIVASDGTNSEVQEVSVTINDVSEAGPVFTSGASVSMDEEQQDTGYTPAATPDVDGAAVSYAITGGADQALFELDASTGELKFKSDPDHESPSDSDSDNVYEVELTATDEDGNQTTQTVSITVDDISDEDPVFTSGTSISVDENETDTGYTAAATPDVDGATITYSLLDSPDAQFFDIDPDTGELTLKAGVDYESLPSGFANQRARFYSLDSGDQFGSSTSTSIRYISEDDNPDLTPVSGTVNGSLEDGEEVLINGSDSDVVFLGTVEIDGHTMVVAKNAFFFYIYAPASVGSNNINWPSNFFDLTINTDPFDLDAANVLTVYVEASDGTNSEVQEVSVTINDVSEAGPVFTSDASASIDENGTSTGITPAATPDVDGTAVTYAITGGADQTLFELDASTGELKFKSAPDHETPGDSDGDNVYQVQLTATDEDGNRTTQTVSITVDDVSEAGPVFTSGTSASINENGTSTGITPAATPDVSGATVTYAITGGADQTLFELDASTGELKFKSAPDHEAPGDADGDNVYRVQLTATDEDNNQTTQTVSITVNNVADAAPVFTSGTSSSFNEGDPLTTAAYTATATDADTASSDLSFSLKATGDHALFDIDGATGVVTFKSAPTYSDGGDNTYDITVIVSDGDNQTEHAVSITVEEEICTAPVSETGTAAVDSFTGTACDDTFEDIGTGDSVFARGGDDFVELIAFDFATIDGGTGYDELQLFQSGTFDLRTMEGRLSSIEMINMRHQQASAQTLQLDQAAVLRLSGDVDDGITTLTIRGHSQDRIQFTDSGWVETGTETEDGRTYIVYTNGTASVRTESGPSVVGAQAADNEAPTISSGTTASVDEDVTVGTDIVYTAAASDPEGTAITYSLFGGDSDLFDIDASTGELTFKSTTTVDYETPADGDGDNVYEFMIVATDESGLTASQHVAITVNDVSEAGPVFTSGTSASVDENGTSTGITPAATPDLDGAAVTYAITGGADQTLFELDASTGELKFKSAPDHETPGDADGDNVYEVQLTATDEDSNQTTQSVSITVDDVSEAGPALTSGTTASMDENETDTGYTPAATPDVDGAPVTYSIVGGEDADLFEIDSATGELKFKSAPDYEAFESGNSFTGYASYFHTIGYANRSGTTSGLGVISEDLNPSDPSEAGTTEGVLEVGEAVLVDGVATGEVFVGNLLVGSRNLLITFDEGESTYRAYVPGTGNLAASHTPNVLFPQNIVDEDVALDPGNTFDVIIEADDGTNTSRQSVVITVNDVDESGLLTSTVTFDLPPQFTNADTTAGVDENVSTATVVYDADAIDPDGTQSDLTYSLVSDGDNDLFDIDADTGEVTFKSSPDHEAPADVNGDNDYEIEVVATDAKVNRVSQSVTITVDDIADDDPVFTSLAAVSVDEGETDTGLTVSADPDLASDAVTYSIVGGAHADLFDIDATTGELSFLNAPDYEAPVSAYAYDSVVTFNSAATQTVHTVNADGTRVITEDPNSATGNLDGALQRGEDFLIDSAAGATYYGQISLGGYDLLISSYEENGVTYYQLYMPEGVGPDDIGVPSSIPPSAIRTTNLTLPEVNTYQVEVEASDGTNTSTQMITVSVNDVDEGASLLSGFSLSTVKMDGEIISSPTDPDEPLQPISTTTDFAKLPDDNWLDDSFTAVQMQLDMSDALDGL